MAGGLWERVTRCARSRCRKSLKDTIKIKGENACGCFLTSQNFKIHSRVKEHVANSKYTD